MAHPFFEARFPLAIGHRGCAGEAPENTLASFERGLAHGADVLETDVHLTRDGVPVLIHDDGVERTTEGRGRVGQLDWSALQALDAGYRYQARDGSHPFRGQGLRIPSLADALAALPGSRFNLELKEGLPGIVEQTLDAIAAAGRDALTLVTAAEDPLMASLRKAVKQRGAGVALGASAGEVGRFASAAARGETPPPGPMALQIPPAFAGRALVTPELVDAAHRSGVQVHVWTINEPDEIAALLALGVDGVVSDFPARVVAARQA